MAKKDTGFDTRQVALSDVGAVHSHIVPVYLTSTYSFGSAGEAARAFSGESCGYVYSRVGNPTVDALVEKVACLEGTDGGLACASGMAAIATAVYGLLKSGDHILSTAPLYGGTHDLFSKICPKHGISVTYIDGSDPDSVRSSFQDGTKAVFVETPANPTLKLTDLAMVAEECGRRKVPLIVDNTFMSPYLQRPIELGATYVVHSTTKYINGHGSAVGGIVVGSADDIGRLNHWHHETGPIMGPMEAFVTLQGLKTLSLRMKKHCENALQIAQFLEHHAKVSSVYYPGLESFPQHELAQTQMKGSGGLIAFEVAGGKPAGIKLIDAICKSDVIRLAVSLGCVDTLIQHPASMTHAHVPEDEKKQAGITDGLLRLSVGLEDVEDLISTLESALRDV